MKKKKKGCLVKMKTRRGTTVRRASRAEEEEGLSNERE